MQDDLSYLAAIDRIAKLETQVAELEARTNDAEEAEWATKDLFWQVYEEYLTLGGKPVSFEEMEPNWKQRAETAETLLEEAQMALAPFIRLADNVFSDGKNATVADEVTLWCFNDTDITFGDLRRARATLDRIGK